MQVELDSRSPEELPIGLLCVGAFEGEELPSWLAATAGAEDVRSAAKKLTVLRPELEGGPERVLVAGLGKRAELDAERVRAAAALAVRQAQRYELASFAWQVPGGDASTAAALAGASILTAFRFNELKSKPDPDASGELGELLLVGLDDGQAERAAEIVPIAAASARGSNRARRLQSLPANIADPAFLAERAREIAAEYDAVEVEVLDGARITELGMGGLEAVGAGSAKEPLLIALRY